MIHTKQSYGIMLMLAAYTALILLLDWPKNISKAWGFLNVAVFCIGYIITMISVRPK